MTGIINDEAICLKKYLTEQELKELYALQYICKNNDNVNLKLELEYRRNLNKATSPGLKNIDEFLYYADGKLAAYLSISCFGGNIGEITGMTHPKWRRNGIFSRLYQLARQEYLKRNYNKVLLLADRNSLSAAGFMKVIGASYDFSEYHMRLPELSPVKEDGPVTLRTASSKDIREIRRQNSIYFDDTNEEDLQPEELELADKSAYLAVLNGETIGKIEMEFYDSTAYIYGFGILPAYRGKGYGRATLQETLRLIADRGIRHAELDVVCTNSSALHLYQSCGFKEESIMDYYRSEPEA
jgi:ribosomal protein S18 acetylase RimI-like enzyme